MKNTSIGRRRLGLRASPHHVSDFSTLPQLIKHASAEGALYVLNAGPNTKIYYPRGDGSFEEAAVWQKGGYWHGEGPSARKVVRKPPQGAESIRASVQRRAAENRRTVHAKGIYNEMPFSPGDYVLHFREDRQTWSVDRVGDGGTHTTIGSTRGYGTTENVRKAIEYDAHVNGKQSGAVYDAEGAELGAIKQGRVYWFPGSLAIYPYQHRVGASGAVRDYIAVDRHDRKLGGPFKHYSEADDVAGPAGVVKFVPSRGRTSTEVHASRNIEQRSIHMGKTPDGHEFLPPTLGSDRRYAYVPFARLSPRDQSHARAAYPHKRVGGMYDFKDEHYYYPVKVDGSLASGARFLAIPRAWFDDAKIMQSLGYATPNEGWQGARETRSAHHPVAEAHRRRRAKR